MLKKLKIREQNFVHLHAHSEFSFLDSIVKTKGLGKNLRRYGFSSYAITDHGNVNGVFSFVQDLKEAEVKPIVGCLFAGQEIITIDGVKCIEDIVPGDLVFTHRGRFRKVKRTSTREYSGIAYDICLAATKRKLALTEEHPILIRNDTGELDWKKPCEIECGFYGKSGKHIWNSYVCFPKLQKQNVLIGIDISRFLDGFTVFDNMIHKKYKNGLRSWDIPKRFIIDEKFARMLGLFVAEGYSGLRGRISYTFNIEEEQYANEVKEFFSKRFSLNVRINERRCDNTLRVTMNHLPLSIILGQWCGAGSHNKKVPEFIFRSPEKVIWSFLWGLLDGDGKNPDLPSNVNRQATLTTSSKNLSWGTKVLLAKFGHWSSVSTYEQNFLLPFNPYRRFSKTIEDEDFVYKPIKSVSKRQVKETVYNIEVEEDNSYVSDFVLHNCEFYVVPDRHKKGIPEAEKLEIVANGKDSGLTPKQSIKKEEKRRGTRKRSHVVALAKNNTGWKKIIRAVELSHSEGFYYRPRIDYEILKKLAPDVILLTACLSGVPSQLIKADKWKDAIRWTEEFADYFADDFFIEIQPNDIEEQVTLNLKLVELAKHVGVRIVATNDVHYVRPEDWETHDVLLALRDSQGKKSVLVTDTDRFRYPTNQLYLKKRNEMAKSFLKFHPNIDSDVWEAALDVTNEIASRIDDDVLEYRKGVLPRIQIEKEYDGNPDKKLWALVREGWKWREIAKISKGKTGLIDWEDGEPREVPLKEVYTERVEHEMEEITRLGFSKYFLVMWDLVKWTRKRGIRVGPGRGSVGGSIVAFLLGITSLDSVKYNCQFSRFISPDRIDYPDIDLDFPGFARDEIKQYLINKYGRSRVAGISTFGRMKGKLVLKDVGRVHDVPWQKTESVTKLVHQRADGDDRASYCLEDTFEDFPETKWYKEQWPHVIRHASKLEGNVRHLGVHPAGLVICDKPLRSLVPVQYQKAGGGEYLTGWDKKQVEAIGLLKLDILGIDGLQYIQRCIDLVKERTGEIVEPENWKELDDPEVYENFTEGNTELVWQMNQFGAISLLKRLKPEHFDHLVATTSLIRPGPKNAGITDDYVKRRHGKKTKSLHFKLDEILKSTHGLMVYQEDVIKIVHDIGGFNWAEADRIRKDIGKKKGVEYLRKTYLDRFIEGAARFEISEVVATKIWNQIAEFGQYGFGKAHAAGYSILSYWTMYLKIKYPLEFMTAALESENDDAKRRAYIKEARRLGLNVIGPDVNVSGKSFTIDPNLSNTIRAGLMDVKGVGKKSVDKIVDGAPYLDLRDFLDRSSADKTAIVAFLKVGALDGLLDNSKYIVSNIDEILKYRARKKDHLKDKYWTKLGTEGKLNGVGTYSLEETEQNSLQILSLPPVNHRAEKLKIYLRDICRHIRIDSIGDFDNLFDEKALYSSEYHVFVGEIINVKYYQDKAGKTANLLIEDETGSCGLKISAQKLVEIGAGSLSAGNLVTVVGRKSGFWKLAAGELALENELDKITEDPFFLYRKFIGHRESLSCFCKQKQFRSCVYVISVDEKTTKKGDKMAVACCLDTSGQIRDVVVWPDDYRKFSSRFIEKELFLLHIKSSRGQLVLNSGIGNVPILRFAKYHEKIIST